MVADLLTRIVPAPHSAWSKYGPAKLPARRELSRWHGAPIGGRVSSWRRGLAWPFWLETITYESRLGAVSCGRFFVPPIRGGQYGSADGLGLWSGRMRDFRRGPLFALWRCRATGSS